MTSVTDVRAWLRENDYSPPGKGRIPSELQQAYDAAHPGDEGEGGGAYPAPAPSPSGADYDGGITEADFPSGPAGGSPDDIAAERKPRSVRASRKQEAKSFRQRIWGGKTARPKKKHPRLSLKGLIEDTWMDAAWTFQGLPPLEKILYLQAPLAGQLLEDTVKDTAVDRLLQPVARVDRQFKAFEALAAPVWVGLIMTRGRRDEEGAYSPETKMMFGALRHSLLAMSRVVDIDFEAMKEKSAELKGKSTQIDEMIAWLFEMPGVPAEADGQMAGAAA